MTEATGNRGGEAIELNWASRRLPVATDSLRFRRHGAFAHRSAGYGHGRTLYVLAPRQEVIAREVRYPGLQLRRKVLPRRQLCRSRERGRTLLHPRGSSFGAFRHGHDSRTLALSRPKAMYKVVDLASTPQVVEQPWGSVPVPSTRAKPNRVQFAPGERPIPTPK